MKYFETLIIYLFCCSGLRKFISGLMYRCINFLSPFWLLGGKTFMNNFCSINTPCRSDETFRRIIEDGSRFNYLSVSPQSGSEKNVFWLELWVHYELKEFKNWRSQVVERQPPLSVCPGLMTSGRGHRSAPSRWPSNSLLKLSARWVAAPTAVQRPRLFI